MVWPAPDGTLRFTDPVEAARSFAADMVGFANPIVGDFRQGDARSGEVEVRAVADGPTTTVLVRQMSDGAWWVVGAMTAEVQLDDPVPGMAIDNPLLLAGRAIAMESNVNVAIFRRGSLDPLGTGSAIGGGTTALLPFTGEVRWANPGGGWGTVVVFTTNQDGRVLQAAAIPVGFIGGD